MGPAGLPLPRMAGHGTAGDGVWWWTVLATQIDVPVHALAPSALWPPSTPGTEYVAAEFGRPACVNGSAAASCLVPFGEAAQALLNVSTQSGAFGAAPRLWRLWSVAPVLPGGWVLVGEEAKVVRLSPQRVLAAAVVAPAPGASDALDAAAELGADGAGLAFNVLGAAGEAVRLTLVAPATAHAPATAAAALGGHIILVDVVTPASGTARVQCTAGSGPRASGCVLV